MDKLKRRDFLKLAALAVFAPKRLIANNKTFITLLDNELPNSEHKPYKGGIIRGKDIVATTITSTSIRINDRPLSDYEDVVIQSYQCGWE